MPAATRSSLTNKDTIILANPSTPPVTPTLAWLFKNPVCLLGFGFGTGLAPKAPGTFGTLPALPLAWLLLQLPLPWHGLLLVAAMLFAVGIPICSYTEQKLGRQDYGGIVWDEIAAMVLVLLFVPLTWAWWLAAFAVFRFFDALKPWPIRWFDARIHGGLGIMLDDLLAAVFSLGLLWLLAALLAW